VKIAGKGDTIKVHYTGKLDDGNVFDTSREGDPLEFVVGEGNLLKDFEDATVGLVAGQSTTVQISAENAYGPYRDDLLLVVPKEQLPSEVEEKVGATLFIECEDGVMLPVTIKEIAEDTITLDSNHVLAGKDLIFDIELVEIV
jgi:peptidylprolyl isomerase